MVRAMCFFQIHHPIVNIGVVRFTTSGIPVLGQDGYTLTCRVFVTDNVCTSITYQWTKNNVTTVQLQTVLNTLTFNPLRLSDAGLYTCYATITSLSFSSNVTVMGYHVLSIQSRSNLVQPCLNS